MDQTILSLAQLNPTCLVFFSFTHSHNNNLNIFNNLVKEIRH